MTAITGLRRLPLVDRDDDGVVLDLREPTWDRPAPVAPAEGDRDDAGDRRSSEPGDEAVDGVVGGPDATAPHRLRPSRVLPVVAAVLVGALAVAFVGRDGAGGPGPGEAEVTVDGRARVTRVDGRTEVVTDRARLTPGDRFDLERGTATFELAAEVRMEATTGTSLVMDRNPTLRAGELLVDAPVATTVEAGPAAVTVGSGGAARLARTYAVQVGTYRGTARLASAGVTRTVPELRAADVAAAGEVGAPRPVTYEADDRWDNRYLADALALDRQLGPLAASMRATDLDPAALLRQVRTEVADVPTSTRLTALLGDRPVRLDTSIGAAVIGNGVGGTFAERWRSGLAFHDDGATWGLVAMSLDAPPDDVTASLRRALDQGTAVLGTSEDAAGTDGEAADPASDGATDPQGSAVAGSAEGGPDGSGQVAGGSPGSAGSSGGSAGGSSGGGVTPGVTVPTVTVPGGSTPPVTVPTVTVPGVTVPPALPVVTQPLGTTVTTIVDSVVGILTPVLTPVVGSGGVLPILPGLGGPGSGSGGGSGGGGLFGG